MGDICVTGVDPSWFGALLVTVSEVTQALVV